MPKRYGPVHERLPVSDRVRALPRVSVAFAWYDLWVGAYWDCKRRVLYVCPLPTLLLTVRPRNAEARAAA